MTDTQTASQTALISTVAKSAGLKASEVRRVLDEYALAVGRELADGRRVRLPGLGSLGVRDTPAKSGTVAGKPYSRPAGRRIVFSAAGVLKATVSPGE